VLPHLPYSPYLAPSDYHLFGPTKKMLGGKKFGSHAEMQSAIRQWLGQQPAILTPNTRIADCISVDDRTVLSLYLRT